MSDDLIKRSDAIKALEREKSDWNNDYNVPIDNCIKRLNKVKSADRPQGEWIDKGKNLWKCSNCEMVIYSESEQDRNEFHKWCSRCGSRMKGADDE